MAAGQHQKVLLEGIIIRVKYDSVGFLTEDTVFVSDISSSKYQICLL